MSKPDTPNYDVLLNKGEIILDHTGDRFSVTAYGAFTLGKHAYLGKVSECPFDAVKQPVLHDVWEKGWEIEYRDHVQMKNIYGRRLMP